LLKAARRVFARDGFEAARIEDIAADAGYTRGAFYANFAAKEDLFFALLEWEITEKRHELEALLGRSETREERLRALRDFYVRRVSDRQWVMLSLEFKLFAVRRDNIRAKMAEAHRRIRSTINFDFMTDLFPERSDDGHACDVWRGVLEAALSGMTLEHAYDPKRLSENDAKEALAKILETFVPGFQDSSDAASASTHTVMATAPGSGTPRHRSPR
jgi:AcrR family transcriptional regulator